MEDKKKLFLDPPNAYRAKPFWAWNGDLQEAELKRQIGALKDMGFGGYFMHSRVGLATEYLGEEWFRLINESADYGHAQGLENWIYDEDRWPSGSAGGLVTKDPAYRMKHIRMRTGPVCGDGEIIAIFSCRRDGKDVYDVKRVTEVSRVAGDILWFEIITRPEDSNYNDASYLDTMNRAATDAFIKSTHERYLQQCGRRIGDTITGIFTDEPHRGELLVDVFREGMDFSACIPYTDALFDRFEKDWGYDLRDQLPAIFLRENGEKVSQVKWHYCETLQRLFLENHILPVSQWCKQHRMVYTGHMLHEDSLSAQALMTGSVMRCYEHMDYPGVDLLGNSNVNYNIVKQVASVANQCGKRWILSEMYGASGWHMTLQDYKRIGDWQAILGINLRCPHLSWYTMAGESKRDFPASISFQSGWYKEYKYLEDYYARLGVFMVQGTPVRDVLVISPVESMWCSYYSGWAQWLVTKDEDCLTLEASYTELSRLLLQNHVEYDYGDEEMLSRLAKVEGNILTVGMARYKKVVIPQMFTIRSTTLKLLEQFQRCGGKVIVYKDLPQYVDAKPAKLSLGNAPMASLLEDRAVTVEDERVLTAVRKTEDGRYYIMLLNTDEHAPVSAGLHLPQGCVEQWDPETGEIFGISERDHIFLHPGQMRLLSVGGQQAPAAAKKELQELRLEEKFRYTTDEPNVLVVDKAVCDFAGKTLRGDILKIDRSIREQLGLAMRGEVMLQPWYMAKNELPPYFNFKLTYTFQSQIACEGFLATEATGVVQVNGQTVTAVDGWWIDPCFRKIPIQIQKGFNTITVQDSYTQRQNLEAMYILGDFGVFHGVIQQKPERVALGDMTKQGFPHYSGKFTYIFEQPVKETALLQFKDLCGAAAIRVNGKILSWQPYCIEVTPCDRIEIQLVLTRRNTFGPLHQLPATDVVCNPQSFVTEGERWTEKMVVLPWGLTV